MTISLMIKYSELITVSSYGRTYTRAHIQLILLNFWRKWCCSTGSLKKLVRQVIQEVKVFNVLGESLLHTLSLHLFSRLRCTFW